ncbi:MAG: ribose 5-phosphate isomerase B [Alloprevotella sp.]|nr:ribose 5-phosphate isomerase B [Alloprevotella sp.]
MLPIGLASDHAGFPLKEHVKTLLDELQLPYIDYGTNSTESCDYPDFAHALARAIERGDVERGIAVCGSGQGITITLNKHRAVRAALSWLPEIAALARRHNDANVLTMPGRFISNDEADAIVRTFLSTPFEGGRHQRRVEKITEGL